MQIIQIIQIRSLSALKELDHEVGIDYLSDLWNVYSTPLKPSS